MTRRELFLAAAAATTQLNSQLHAELPARIDYHDYPSILPDHVRALAKTAYEKRNRDIAATTSPDAIRKRQRWARETFWKLAGTAPASTPLQVRKTGSLTRKTYRIDKLLYESRPGVVISADLYVPQGSGPFPGVLFQMGHAGNGKASETYQRCCQGLAQLGYLVLAFDPMGQGERTNYPGPKGLTRLGSVDEEHTLPGQQLLLIGQTATMWQTWDAIRSLDVLASHPQVDAKRLASTGQSGGATVTMLLACVEDRLAAVAISSGNTENFACADFHPPGSTDDAEQDLIGSGPLGMDRWDLLWPFAPKPLLIITSAKDFFGTYSPSYAQSNHEEFPKLQKVYRTLGHAADLQYFESPLPHGLSYEQRVAIYQFFEKHLKQSDRVIDAEPRVPLETDADLFAAPDGNVRNSGGKTPHQLMQSMIPATPGNADLGKVLGYVAPRGALKVLATVPSVGCTVSSLEVQSAPQVWYPVWSFQRKTPLDRKLVLLDAGGRNSHWREGGLGHRLAAEGLIVYAADVRGIGDMRPEYSPGAPAYTNEHERMSEYAWASLILGQSMLAQRVQDIIALTSAIGTCTIAARGELTVPVLCAAALDPRIERVYLVDHLHSWRSLVEAEVYAHPFANFVPGILQHTDLPQIASSLAPRRVVLANVVNGANRPMPVEEVRRAYVSPNIEVQDKPAWEFSELLRFAR
jgi:dienelactone hydrolase